MSTAKKTLKSRKSRDADGEEARYYYYSGVQRDPVITNLLGGLVISGMAL